MQNKKAEIASVVSAIVLAIALCAMFIGDAHDVKKANSKVDSKVETTTDDVTYEEIYNEYEDNPARAKKLYLENRYTIEGSIVKIEQAGLREAYIGYNVYVKVKVGDDTVRICANFDEKEIIELSKGDKIKFSGECRGQKLFYKCKLQ